MTKCNSHSFGLKKGGTQYCKSAVCSVFLPPLERRVPLESGEIWRMRRFSYAEIMLCAVFSAGPSFSSDVLLEPLRILSVQSFSWV